MKPILSSLAYRQIVELALQEDLQRGDITTDAVIDPALESLATIVARQSLCLSGVEVARTIFERVDPGVRFQALARDGDRLYSGKRIIELQGSAASILKAERTALNFLQRLSGVATLTARFVSELPSGSATRITDTRKTTPGLRALERYAIRCGGGFNHRDDLGAAVLIKDNHIAAAGGIAIAIERARSYAPHTCRIECEVDHLHQLDEALAAGADIIMLDNFDDAEVAEALHRIAGRAIVEVSGGITPERIRTLATLGVDVISIGALTHSAPAVDIGLDWKRS